MLSRVVPCRLHKDAAMTASPYPHLFATLGEAATRLPDDLARTLEDTFVALQSGNSAGAITLQACLQHIRQAMPPMANHSPATTARPGNA
ncbi:hypothetical protein A7X87_15000 [Stenotrophomonas maltophilia]|nr:hypothetical protein A7X87_15000 [Stenotrophomonas maltophilia]